MKNNNNLLGKIVSTAKNLWSKLDDPMIFPSANSANEIIKQDEVKAAVSEEVQNFKPVVPTSIPQKKEDKTVCKLCNYQSEAAQKVISRMSYSSDLTLTRDKDNNVFVYCNSTAIGTLPPTIAQRALEEGTFSVYYDKFEKQSDSTIAPYIKITWPFMILGKPVSVTKVGVRKISNYPDLIGRHHLIYAAKIPFRHAENIDVERDILDDCEKEVQMHSHGNYVSVSYNGITFGYIDNPGLSEVIDELKQNDCPYTGHLLDGCENIYFHAYEDKRIGHENDEQTVCKISAYKAHEKQMVIWLLSPGDQIHMEQYGDRVLLDYNGWPIGKLPPKFAKRYLQEGAYAAFVEKIDIQEIENEEGDIDLHIPYIRIYWNKKDVSKLDTQITRAQTGHYSGGSAMNSREHKGNSIIALPDNYVVIDIETTGLDFWYDDIIEISGIRYTDNTKAEEFSTLVNPERPIPEFITELTGITNQMVATAPTIEIALPQFMDFVGASVLVGQNVAFDVNFLYDAAAELGLAAFANDHINIMRIARKVYPDLGSYRLGNIAAACGVPYKGAHRSLADCEITAACYDHLKRKVLETMSEAEFADLFKKKAGSGQSYADFIASMDLDAIEANEDSPIFGKTVVFTGELERMKRKEALTLVAQLGGIPADSITKKVNYLVVGNAEFAHSVKNGRTSKMKKAEALALKGNDINIISEDTFFQMIEEK